jgi:hypothetical protein
MLTASKELIVTEHAYARMKERNGWNKKTATRMVTRIYKNGTRPEQVKGYLKCWINSKREYGNAENEYILFGDMLYIFRGKVMLTVIHTPPRAIIYHVS